LIQLFLIPMLIVGIIVMVWLMFSWLAHLGTRPEELAADLEKLHAGSWQKALTLANMLRDPANSALRRDVALATRLSTVLAKQLDEGGDGQDEVRLRMWLCRALGQFDIDTGVATLIRAANEERSSADVEVRRAALQAIGLLADRLGNEPLRNQPGLLEALGRGARDRSDDPAEEQLRGQLRATAAFALGIVGGDEALQQLALMLSDPYPDARYNAATGLARHGDARAVGRLLEMLAPDNPEAVRFEQPASDVAARSSQRVAETARAWKRSLVWKNGLRATRELIERNPAVERERLLEAVRRLSQVAGLPTAVRVELAATLRSLEAAR
jgi:hypothetical protein